MAIITNNSRTRRTEDFFSKNLYFGFGKTSPWTDENLPDQPLTSTNLITELAFISKITEIKYIKPSLNDNADINFKNTHWDIVTPVDSQTIYNENVSNLFIKTVLNYDTYELISFRQVGLLENPKDLNNNFCTNERYDDSELTNQGILHYLDNRIVTNRQVNQLESISIILEF
jgi:hypothetical protein